MKNARKLGSLLLCLMMILTMMPLGGAMAEDLKTVTILCPSERTSDHPLSRVDEYTCYQVLADWLAEDGVKLEFDLVAPEQYDQTLQMRLAAGLDLPDIIALGWSFDDTAAMQLGLDGTFINVLEACEKYDADGSIWNYLDNLVPQTRGLTTASDGGVYWFVYPYSAKWYDYDENGKLYPMGDVPGVTYGININKDWLDKVGIEYSMFMTLDEFKDALVTFREKDANGDGAVNEVLDVDITHFGNGIAASLGLYELGSFTNTSDTVQCPWYSENIKEYLTYMHELYTLGVYNSEALSEGMIDQICAAGEASAFQAYHGWSSTYDFVEDKYLYAPILLDEDKGENGFNLFRADSPQSIYMKFAITDACDDLESAIKVFDRVYTDEYAVLSYYGTEATYHVNENGFLVRDDIVAERRSDPEWLDLPLMYTVSMNALPAVNTTNFILSEYTHFPAWDEFYALEKYVFTNADKVTVSGSLQPMALATEEEGERIAALENTLQTYSSELLVDMILGNKNIDDLDTYIDEMKKLGLDEYLAIFQARHDRYVAAN